MSVYIERRAESQLCYIKVYKYIELTFYQERIKRGKRFNFVGENENKYICVCDINSSVVSNNGVLSCILL